MARTSSALTLLAALALVAGSALPVMAQEDEAGSGPVEGSGSAEAQAPAPESAKPSLPDDLPRRKTPDVPRFAGPDTMRVSGGYGAYTWHEVLFGVEEADVRVALMPSRKSCSARVRLIEDGDALVNEWFTADSGEKQRHETVFLVDYLAGKLRVDSDCESWSVKFTPREDPDLEIDIDETHYTVHGNSIEALADQTDDVQGKWAAFTEWYTTWVYWTEESGVSEEDGAASCTVTHGETGVEVSMTYPEWKRPQDADPALIEEWERFMEALRSHELGHVTIAVQGADAIDDRLDSGFTAPTCDEARDEADKAADRIFKRYAKASKRYDQETDHGLTQGTGLGG